MEDLYGNLENYNDVNALEELKSENKQLKTKIEDYSCAMDKLQKNILQDFDMLSSEFKKLEHNYSSLLKTARSEIERKTQIINDINKEKDMLVITALKNGNKRVLHIKKNMHNFNRNNIKNKDNKPIHKPNLQNTKEEQVDQNNYESDGHKRLHQASACDRVNIISIDNTIHKQKKCDKVVSNTESFKYPHSHIKENIKHENTHNNTVQFKPMDIKNQQKSIPITGVENEKISLCENLCSTTKDLQQYGHPRDKQDRKSFLMFDNDRHSSKSSESSNRDERVLGYDKPSRDLYKNYKYDSDKHRSRDKFFPSQRHKRYSPERYGNKKTPRDHYEDNSNRYDMNRIRNRENSDRFYHHSYKEQWVHDEKNNYNENERYMHTQERSKHKIPHEYEEPYPKRQRSTYSGRGNEDVRWNSEKIVEHKELTETFERLEEQYTPWQSSDYIYKEIPSEPNKVTLDTPQTPLEDPRLTTSKYILSNDNGLANSSTEKGRDVNLKPVDKIIQNLQAASRTNVIKQPPLEKQFIKNVHNNPDDPKPKIISGEEVINTQVIQNEHVTKEKPSEIYHKDGIDKTSYTTKDKSSVEKPAQCFLASYTIPKVKKCSQGIKDDALSKELTLDNLNAIGNNTDNDKQNSQSDCSKSPIANVKIHDNITNNNLKHSNKTCTIFSNSTDAHDIQKVLSTREIIEGDLELSDETSDYAELQKVSNHNSNEEKVGLCCKTKISHTNRQDNLTISSNQDKLLDENDKNKLIENKLNNEENILQEAKLLPCEKIEGRKKQKSKKKTQKCKDAEHNIETVDRKPKVKKDKKEKPKEASSKFNDLFGDSNSLITPDDLGIPTLHAQRPSQLAGSYVPIFEDAQDATDLEQNKNIKTDILSQLKVIGEANISAEEKSANISEERNVDLHGDISKPPLEVKLHDIKVSNKSIGNTMNHDSTPETVSKENDVVATIIISTGIQPDDINTESRAESLVNAEELLCDDIAEGQNNAIHKTQDVLIKALATSTPYKQMVNQVDSKLPDSTCTSNSMVMNGDYAETLVSTRNNTLEPSNDDIPDVRIFVKRRRRIVKTAK